MLITKIIIFQQQTCIYTFAYHEHKLCFVVKDYLEDINTESIVKARINKFNHHTHTAFVEYAGNHSGFINLAKELKVQDGSLVMAQLMWLGDKSKQAKLRSNWQLVGKYVVYQAGGELFFSGKALTPTLELELKAKAMHLNGQWVLRSAVSGLTDLNLVIKEMEEIYLQVQQLNKSSEGSILYYGLPNYLKLLRSLNLGKDCQVISNCADIYTSLLAYQELWQIKNISLDLSLSADNLIDDYMSYCKLVKIELSSGAYLEIHSLAGIHIIDVNGNNLNLSHAKLNYLLLDAIYSAVCVRNLQGIILIDFIKNMHKLEQEKILEYLKKCFKDDLTQTKVLGFSHSGLCELIRSKF